MPDNLIQWILIAYLAFGAFGGFLYIANLIVDKMAKKDGYNPWEVQDRRVIYHEPMPHMMEAPISARKK